MLQILAGCVKIRYIFDIDKLKNASGNVRLRFYYGKGIFSYKAGIFLPTSKLSNIILRHGKGTITMMKAARQSSFVALVVSRGGAGASRQYTQPQSSDKLDMEQKLFFSHLVA